MSVVLVAQKTLRQKLRDPISLALTLLTAPGFVLLYGLFFAGQRAFEAYVPGLLVFAIIMVVFSSAMTLAREVESGAVARLRLTPLSAQALLVGSGLVEVGLGAGSLAISLGAARALGFSPAGPIAGILVLGIVGASASVGLGWLSASVSPTLFRAFLIASVLMFLLLLFSGVIFPRPEAPLLTVHGTTVGAFDLLPTTQLHAALTKVIAGETWAEIWPRALALSVLSFVYLALGVLAFGRAQRWGALRV